MLKVTKNTSSIPMLPWTNVRFSKDKRKVAIVVIGIHWLLMRRDKPLHVILSVLLMGFTFLGLFTVFNYFEIGNKWADPLVYIVNMIRGTESIKFSWVIHSAASQPWKWLYNPPDMAYYFNPNYYGILSYTVWALIIPATVYMIWQAAKRSTAAMFGLAWVYGTYFIWFAIVLVTDRVTYPYYLLACVGGLCIGIGLALEQLLDFTKLKKWELRLRLKFVEIISAVILRRRPFVKIVVPWYRICMTGVILYCLGHLAILLILTAIVNRPHA